MPRNAAQAAGFLLGFWLVFELSPFGCAGRAAAGQEPVAAALEAELLQAVNRTRGQRSLVALSRRGELDAVARAHAEDMARRGYFSHFSPEGRNPVDRLDAAGLEGFTLAAENVGRTDQQPPNQRILEAWLASPDHRRNLLGPAFNATGIGIARAPGGSLIYTQVFVHYPR